jgi:NAD(P)-dependent dehydrogenase (short-subunit alcohol dehydrogenase family)
MASKPVIFITGGNAGLGFETVKALCQSSQAYTILLGGRNGDKAAAAAQKLQTEFPTTASILTPVQVDIEDDASISQAFEHVAGQHGRLDVLINNAGSWHSCWSDVGHG